jgi:dihydrofolate reductase
MRKLKLQVQISVDGFVGRPNGELDYMTWSWDDKIKNYVNELTDSCDTILLGRKMTDGFVSHWTRAVADPADQTYPFAKKMVDFPKVVFTKTIDKSKWANTVVANGDLSDEVNKLKNRSGKDIIVYGGAGFVSSLVSAGLIDEYYLFVNPAAIGSGLTIFNKINGKLDLQLVNTTQFDCGIALMKYVPTK